MPVNDGGNGPLKSSDKQYRNSNFPVGGPVKKTTSVKTLKSRTKSKLHRQSQQVQKKEPQKQQGVEVLPKGSVLKGNKAVIEKRSSQKGKFPLKGAGFKKKPIAMTGVIQNQKHIVRKKAR